jgi:dTDP-4-dehydrorhamnose reductase
LKVVNDQYGSPTWTYRLALQIKELLKHDTKGTYHATSDGYCTRLEFAQYVLKKLKLKATLEACSLNDYSQAAARPSNCILENRLLKKQGISIMSDWKKDVGAFLDRFGEKLIKKAKAGEL